MKNFVIAGDYQLIVFLAERLHGQHLLGIVGLVLAIEIIADINNSAIVIGDIKIVFARQWASFCQRYSGNRR